MKTRDTSIDALIKSLNLMGGKIAPKCAKGFKAMNEKMTDAQEQAILTLDAELRLDKMVRDLQDNNFLRRDDFERIIKEEFAKITPQCEMQCEFTWLDLAMVFGLGFMGGILGCAAWSAYG